MQARPTFATTLAEHFVGMHVQKRLFGARFVRGGPLLTTGVWLFETSAVLGQAFHHRDATFVTPFAGPVDLPGIGRDVATTALSGRTCFEVFMRHAMHAAGFDPSTTAWQEWWLASADDKLPVHEAVRLAMFHANRRGWIRRGIPRGVAANVSPNLCGGRP